MINLSIYRVFLSGPTDVGSDLEVAAQAVADASFVLEPLGIRFETFDWSKVTPGLSIEPQARINEQALGYDVLVSIIGARLGTPTENHLSGTVEEIEKAIVDAESSPFGADSVVVFFKKISIDSDSPLIEEASRVRAFRSSLMQRKVLFKSYEDESGLRESIFRTLGLLAKQHARGGEYAKPVPAQALGPVALSVPIFSEAVFEDNADEDEGILDYMIEASEKSADVAARVKGIGDAVVVLGAYLTHWVSDVGDGTLKDDPVRAKETVNLAAKEIEVCASEIDKFSLGFSDAFSGTLDAYEGAMDLQLSDLQSEGDFEALSQLDLSIGSMIDGISQALRAIAGMHSVVRGLPRMTARLNSSKKHLLKSLERVTLSWETGISRASELKTKIRLRFS